MIPLKQTYDSIDKSASIGMSVVKFVKNHPWITLGSIGAPIAALSIADKIHPLHQIASEERKRVLMKDQISILGDILNVQKKDKEEIKPKLIVPDLT